MMYFVCVGSKCNEARGGGTMKERAGGQSSCRQALQGSERSELDGTRLCYRERSHEVLRVHEHRASKPSLLKGGPGKFEAFE